jgi:Inorganic pyrophosphatase
MVVEIPKRLPQQVRIRPGAGRFRLDRVLYSPVHYPGDYGFIPGTLASDGDPIDVLARVEEPSFSHLRREIEHFFKHLQGAGRSRDQHAGMGRSYRGPAISSRRAEEVI